ncbi:MAG: hypothetical protein K2X27_11485 [Candidatus Obscuribacterales bacterium]|nr:hypothetical protein [Candidatus Obscuribacterales bacterium]
MSLRTNARNRKAQSLIEVLAGAMVFLVPISLAALDLSVMLVANSANDHLVKNVARAAADQDSQVKALDAAKQCLAKFPKSSIIVDVELDGGLDYQDDQQVAVKTVMIVKLPVSLGGELKFHALAVEPLVAKPSDV